MPVCVQQPAKQEALLARAASGHRHRGERFKMQLSSCCECSMPVYVQRQAKQEAMLARAASGHRHRGERTAAEHHNDGWLYTARLHTCCCWQAGGPPGNELLLGKDTEVSCQAASHKLLCMGRHVQRACTPAWHPTSLYMRAVQHEIDFSSAASWTLLGTGAHRHCKDYLCTWQFVEGTKHWKMEFLSAAAGRQPVPGTCYLKSRAACCPGQCSS